MPIIQHSPIRRSACPARPARRPVTRALARTASAATAALALGACDLRVSDPSIVRPEQLAGAAALPTLHAGAIGDFAVAYAGDGSTLDEGIILAGGLRADEWISTSTFETRDEIDQGRIREENRTNQIVFRNLQRARVSAERAADAYAAAATPATLAATAAAPRRAEALALAGMSYVLLAEHYCSGIPFTTYRADGSFAYGDPEPTDAVLGRALARFDSALAVAVAAKDVRAERLARVGRGRTLLDLGRFAEAAAAVQGVPLDFAWVLPFSTNTKRERNGVFQLTLFAPHYGVAEREGSAGAPFVSANDARVRVVKTGKPGVDGETALVVQQKYAAPDAAIPVATGAEAALIRAEARLQAGDAAGFLAEHAALRASAGLPALAATAATPAADLATLHFRERAFWLFGTAHRLGDLRRQLQPPYARSFAAVFPTGTYPKGDGAYGTEANLPVPFDERNNPRFTGCADRTR